jgi:uncharacterized repeat protein (TIGR03803 family)
VQPALVTIYAFTGTPDGGYPEAGLLNVGGTLYGTTYTDGGGPCNFDGNQGCGTVFKVTPAGVETVVYSFQGGSSDGWFPTAALIDVGGTLYGTTQYGGTGNSPECGTSGCGTVFAVTPAGAEHVVYNFQGENAGDGAAPDAALLNVGGTLYGTTALGGSGVCFQAGEHYCGTVFKVTTDGAESVLYNFQGGAADGAQPTAALVEVNGKLFGTTALGGSGGNGSVFKVTLAGVETVLHLFAGSPDGAGPVFSNLLLVNGKLYGTTEGGGAIGDGNNGTVFKITTAGAESVLYSFKGNLVHDGSTPAAGMIDVGGVLYGTTEYGGVQNSGQNGYGTVFKITLAGAETVLHRFQNEPDGAYPYLAGVVLLNGKLYGTTSSGGAGPNGGYGTVFKAPL